jgi:hypothetical protein
MYRPRTDAIGRLIEAVIAAAALGAVLGGCSSIYTDHRDGVTLGVGNAIAANETLQTIDPWPAPSGNTNIAANGQRMQAAVERYRNDKVTPPVDPMQPQAAVAAQSSSQSSSTSSSGSSSTPTTSTLVITTPQTSTASQ